MLATFPAKSYQCWPPSSAKSYQCWPPSPLNLTNVGHLPPLNLTNVGHLPPLGDEDDVVSLQEADKPEDAKGGDGPADPGANLLANLGPVAHVYHLQQAPARTWPRTRS